MNRIDLVSGKKVPSESWIIQYVSKQSYPFFKTKPEQNLNKITTKSQKITTKSQQFCIVVILLCFRCCFFVVLFWKWITLYWDVLYLHHSTKIRIFYFTHPEHLSRLMAFQFILSNFTCWFYFIKWKLRRLDRWAEKCVC